jgi:hypothetical protein
MDLTADDIAEVSRRLRASLPAFREAAVAMQRLTDVMAATAEAFAALAAHCPKPFAHWLPGWGWSYGTHNGKLVQWPFLPLDHPLRRDE